MVAAKWNKYVVVPTHAYALPQERADLEEHVSYEAEKQYGQCKRAEEEIVSSVIKEQQQSVLNINNHVKAQVDRIVSGQSLSSAGVVTTKILSRTSSL